MDRFLEDLNATVVVLMILVMIFSVFYFISNPIEFYNIIDFLNEFCIANREIVVPLVATFNFVIVSGLILRIFCLVTKK